jgi:hypothetical protein
VCTPHTRNTLCLVDSCDLSVRKQVGLSRTIYIRCTYGIFGREITKYMVIYGVFVRLWPTLHPTPCTLANPTPYTLHPGQPHTYTLHPGQPYTLQMSVMDSRWLHDHTRVRAHTAAHMRSSARTERTGTQNMHKSAHTRTRTHTLLLCPKYIPRHECNIIPYTHTHTHNTHTHTHTHMLTVGALLLCSQAWSLFGTWKSAGCTRWSRTRTMPQL